MIYYSKQIRINYDADNTNEWRWEKRGVPLLDHIFLEDQIKIVATFLQPVKNFPHKDLNAFGGRQVYMVMLLQIFFKSFLISNVFENNGKWKYKKLIKNHGEYYLGWVNNHEFFLYLYLFSERNHRWKISIRRRYNFEWTTPAKSI